MSDDAPPPVGPGDDDPFGFPGLPFLGDLLRMFQSAGPVSWDTARQLAITVANQGASEPNVDPGQRIAIEQLVRVADLHVQGATGLSTVVNGRSATIAPVNRTTWAIRTLDSYRRLLETLATSIANASRTALAEDLTEETDPTLAMLAPMMQALNPMLVGLTAGSMVGHLAGRALGTYDLPVPREESEVMIVVPNVTTFAAEWDLPLDELELWICVHELCHHAVLNLPHVKDRLQTLLLEHARGFVADHETLQERLSDLDITALTRAGDPQSLEELQGLLSNPDLVLGAVQSPQQRALLPQIEALICAVVGYVDHTMDSIGATLIGTYPRLTEALRRRRVEADASDRFVERILGFNLTQAQYDRARRFVDGVVERSDAARLGQLWDSPRTLPTSAEIDAPGLWLARLEYD